MLVSLSSNTARVVRASKVELAWIDRYLKFEDVAESKAQGKPVYIRLFASDRSFPLGLLPIVGQGAARHTWDVEVVDARPKPTQTTVAPDVLTHEFGMRPYQVAALEALASGGKFAAGVPGRGIVKAPTGSGKGQQAAALMAHVKCRWVFLVHRSHLAADVGRRFEEMTGEKVGWIGEGRWEPGERVTVATLQSLYATMGNNWPRFEAFQRHIEGVIVDEVHVGAAATFTAVIRSFPTWWKVGFSGTPLDRSDQRSILAVAHIGPVVYEIPATELIDAGWLARPTVRVIPVKQKPYYSPIWADIYKHRVTKSVVRNDAILAAMRAGERPGMVFVREIAHGRELVHRAAGYGITCEFVNGDRNAVQRDAAIRRLSTGRIDYIVATKVFNEGVDIPCLRTVVLAGGGRSTIDVLQQIGRAMRVTADKAACTIYDIGDKGDPRLHRHSKARIAACKREGYPMVVDRDVFPQGDP